MEHGRFPYSAIVDRQLLRWPNGAGLALWVIPNIEYIHFDWLLRTSPPRAVPPDMIGYANYDYGNRVAIWRLMALLDRFNIRATVALNADVCDVYPAIIREGCRRGWEWMGHGLTNGQSINGLDASGGPRAARSSMPIAEPRALQLRLRKAGRGFLQRLDKRLMFKGVQVIVHAAAYVMKFVARGARDDEIETRDANSQAGPLIDKPIVVDSARDRSGDLKFHRVADRAGA